MPPRTRSYPFLSPTTPHVTHSVNSGTLRLFRDLIIFQRRTAHCLHVECQTTCGCTYPYLTSTFWHNSVDIIYQTARHKRWVFMSTEQSQGWVRTEMSQSLNRPWLSSSQRRVSSSRESVNQFGIGSTLRVEWQWLGPNRKRNDSKKAVHEWPTTSHAEKKSWSSHIDTNHCLGIF